MFVLIGEDYYNMIDFLLTLSQMTNFRLVQIERGCRDNFCFVKNGR